MPAPSQLKIRTSAVNRLFKEVSEYTKDSEQQKIKLEDLKAQGGVDEYDIKQQVRRSRSTPDTAVCSYTIWGRPRSWLMQTR